MLQEFFPFTKAALAANNAAMLRCKEYFERTDEIKEYNQLKMLAAFTGCGVAYNHLQGSTGYGTGDSGRDKLEQVFAMLVGAEAALFRHQFSSGTHTLAVMLFGLLRPGQRMVAVTGRPYDTLQSVIGLGGQAGNGSLKEFGILYDEIPMVNGKVDIAAAAKACETANVCYIQRSRGYANRNALSPQEIEEIAAAVKMANPGIIVAVDNCYGEFTQKSEPTQHGADIMAGSLIKNPGGGIAPTGGYIAGKAHLVERCAHRLTAPGVGGEIGATLDVLRSLYLGLYYAPGVVAEAVKAAIYASALFDNLGLAVSPAFNAQRNDIVTAVETGSAEALLGLCKGIQAASPVDSFAIPEASPMPGYEDDVVMAAGAFTTGASIELSCDGPMRPPYTAYMQGGLNFASAQAGILLAAQKAGLIKNI